MSPLPSTIVRQARNAHFYLEQFLTKFIRVPLWALYALPRSNRPKPSWSVKRTIDLWLLKYNSVICKRTGVPVANPPDHTAIAEGPGIKANWIPPIPHLIVGDVKKWADAAGVESIRIPGYWLEEPGVDRAPGEAPSPGEKLLYNIHGGGFINWSAHPDDKMSNVPKGIVHHTAITRTFSVEYRLTKSGPKPQNPFPAALIDTIAGYCYLVNEVGFQPKDIFVAGDSAGGNLALALVRYLLENANNRQAKLPAPPSGLILCSPWVDLGLPPEGEDVSAYTNQESDYMSIVGDQHVSLTESYFGPLGKDGGEALRYVSPAAHAAPHTRASFKGFPRTFILGGGAEVMRDQIRVLAEEMKKDIGEEAVTFLEMPDAYHDLLVWTGQEPERSEALRRIHEWLSS